MIWQKKLEVLPSGITVSSWRTPYHYGYGGFQLVMGVSSYGWFTSWKIPSFVSWMITGGIPMTKRKPPYESPLNRYVSQTISWNPTKFLGVAPVDVSCHHFLPILQSSRLGISRYIPYIYIYIPSATKTFKIKGLTENPMFSGETRCFDFWWFLMTCPIPPICCQTCCGLFFIENITPYPSLSDPRLQTSGGNCKIHILCDMFL